MATESSPTKAEPACERLSFDKKLMVFDRLLAAVSALGVILGGMWGLYNYFEARQKELNLKKQEIARDVFREKQAVYLSLCDAACAIAASDTPDEVRTKAKDFLKLYYGRAHLIATLDVDVNNAKVDFKDRLFEYLKPDEKSPSKFFGKAALQLTAACQPKIDLRKLDNPPALNQEDQAANDEESGDEPAQ